MLWGALGLQQGPLGRQASKFWASGGPGGNSQPPSKRFLVHLGTLFEHVFDLEVALGSVFLALSSRRRCVSCFGVRNCYKCVDSEVVDVLEVPKIIGHICISLLIVQDCFGDLCGDHPE